MRKRKIAITTDDYKVPTYKKTLKKEGIEFQFKRGLTPNTKIFTIKCDEKDFEKMKNKIHAICVKLEADFGRRN